MSNIEMDMTESADAPVPKRIKVDTKGEAVGDSTSSKAPLDKEQKIVALSTIAHWHFLLIAQLPQVDQQNIDKVANITSRIATYHNCLRQEVNGGKGRIASKVNMSEVLCENVTVEIFIKTMKTIALLYGWEYSSSKANRDMIGTISAMLTLFTTFKNRLAEVRIQNQSLIRGKTGNVTQTIDISFYGLDSRHAPYLEGITYNPTLQSTMAQSLGPMTIAVNLARTTDVSYQQKWKDAFAVVFKNLPYVTQVAQAIAGQGANAKLLLMNLGDLCLYGIARASNKAHFPFAAVSSICASSVNPQAFLAPTLTAKIKFPDVYLNMDFSGVGMYEFYHKLKDATVKMFIPCKAENANLISEAVFHAIFGTQKENLDLVSWMTDHEFVTRKEMGDALKKRTEDALYVVNIYKFKRVCKLASACQTQFFSNASGQISRAPVFSGKMFTKVDKDAKLMEILKSKRGGRLVQPNVDSVLTHLTDCFDIIKEQISDKGGIDYGTTPFYNWAPGAKKFSDLTAVECDIRTERYYYES